ncbi:GNAT family N-acetyltransferase [Fusibacter bizertensis]|uniref:GNAT family N-acetyltransferase n=1 Tax=Fusibacter bizertensis TaxID=1488331 RepID=A0ABT6NCP9_9FIRM|nr:GNAT family N-acetyltransferase [Fusibacter bizertensis]MDH8678196.1 GNAT family N-acetyltransferase [Fusibacter bizertensis]
MKWFTKPFEELDIYTLYNIIALRIDVFILEQTCLYPELDYKDQSSLHLYAMDEQSNIKAYLRILPPGVSYAEVSIGRVVVSPAARGTQLGRDLMQRAIKQINDVYGKVPIRISAQAYLESFYTSLGFQPVSEIYLEDDIPHLEMLFSTE